MLRRSFLILCAAALAACHSDGPLAVTNGLVTVVREGNQLRISNGTDQARAYMAADPNFLALADLSMTALCNTTDATCLRLPAHGSILVPFTDVMGYSATTTKEIQVTTWRVIASAPGANEIVPDEAIVLKL